MRTKSRLQSLIRRTLRARFSAVAPWRASTTRFRPFSGTKLFLQTARILTESPCPKPLWTRAFTRSIAPRAMGRTSRGSSANSRRLIDSILPQSEIENRQSKIASLPLDRARWFAGDIEHDAVNAFDFVTDSVGNARKQLVGDAHPVGGHAVLAFHDAQRDGVFVGALIAHDPNRLYREQ